MVGRARTTAEQAGASNPSVATSQLVRHWTSPVRKRSRMASRSAWGVVPSMCSALMPLALSASHSSIECLTSTAKKSVLRTSTSGAPFFFFFFLPALPGPGSAKPTAQSSSSSPPSSGFKSGVKSGRGELRPPNAGDPPPVACPLGAPPAFCFPPPPAPPRPPRCLGPLSGLFGPALLAPEEVVFAASAASAAAVSSEESSVPCDSETSPSPSRLCMSWATLASSVGTCSALSLRARKRSDSAREAEAAHEARLSASWALHAVATPSSWRDLAARFLAAAIFCSSVRFCLASAATNTSGFSAALPSAASASPPSPPPPLPPPPWSLSSSSSVSSSGSRAARLRKVRRSAVSSSV
mmetsp:Transcript_33871/g.76592  ORF Transcript_33871/g.76592 Transcript_33871/m.76592 type:complete len:354 (-) Transcript_33871:65-1126(-)